MKRLLTILLIFACVPVAFAGALSQQPEIVRVALLKGVDSVRISGNGVVLAIDEVGEPLDAGFPMVVKRVRDGLSVNGRSMRSLRVSSSAPLVVNGKGYRGIIEVEPIEKGLVVVDELPLEDYLVGLINCEISSQWPMETIKAQAVIARSYALFQMESRKNALYHLESTVMDQVYDGCDIEDSRAARGVRESAGEILSFNDKIIQAFYHSNCGGHTEAAENVWGASLPYLQGVDCKYCLTGGAGKWEHVVQLKKFESLLRNGGIQVFGLRNIKPGRRNNSGRLNELTLLTAKGSMTVTAVNFRKAVGYSIIKSTNFDVKTIGDELIFSGAGYGHGVGLCQWGAKQRAEDGFDYREILSYYYPGTVIKKMFRDQ